MRIANGNKVGAVGSSVLYESEYRLDPSPMEYVEHEVPPALAGSVRAIWHLSGGDDVPESPIVPDGCVEIVFNVGDPMQQRDGEEVRLQPKAMVVGQLLRPTTVRPTGVVDVWGVRLQPWAVRQVLGVQGRELRDTVIPLDALHTRRREPLGEALSADTSRERLEALQRALGELTAWDASVSQATKGIVRWAANANDTITVRLLAREAGLSVRRVQTLFDLHVGLSPKSVMRLARFQRALAMLRSRGRFSMGRIAAECGYHDHAHFVRECREFAGVTPSVVAAAPEHLGDVFVEPMSARQAT